MLPNFVGIGGQRAGTTWVYQCLREHPQICVSDVKELHFFDTYFDRGVAWYEQQFQSGPEHQAVGEVTPNYLDCEHAIGRMAEVIPDAKLFAILREPVSRARSAYELFSERYAGLSFVEACQRRPELVRLGQYAQDIERVYAHYPRSQVRIWLYDDLETDPQAFLAELFEFLGVDTTFCPPSTFERYNRAMYPRTQQWLERFGCGWAVDLVKRTPLGRWIQRRHVR